MDKQEAENYVYQSYLKAKKHLNFEAKDSTKRNPAFTRSIIRSNSITPCVVVTGSKGKGSVASMISQILKTRYNVGLMTSPHIFDFCERFKLNNINISDQDFTKYMVLIKDSIDKLQSSISDDTYISPIGIQALLALVYFNDKKTNFNVFECGKGAQYDDVNNIKHEYAIINNIFLEHTRELGNTLEEIAADKAHVINGEQKIVYVAEQDPSVMAIITERAKKYSTTLKVYGKDFFAENIIYTNNGMRFDIRLHNKVYEGITIPLLGIHQAKNCALAFAFCMDVLDIADLEKIKLSLRSLNWMGRMEIISSNPFILLDACINSACCKHIIDVLTQLRITDPTVIIGIPEDKDYVGVVKKMIKISYHIILTQSQNPHYFFSPSQSTKVCSEGISAEWTNSVEKAIEKAKSLKRPIVIIGTTSVIAEVKRLQRIKGI